MMAGQSGKGNPAHKRMSNSRVKDRRARSYNRGLTRKQERRKRQEEAHKRNVAAGTTPWQQAKAARYVARAPKREAWLKRQTA